MSSVPLSETQIAAQPQTAIAHRCTVGSERRKRPSLADLIRNPQLSDGLERGGGPSPFFCGDIIEHHVSSIASTKSFFSFQFSFSGDFSRRASDTLRPPYLAFHL